MVRYVNLVRHDQRVRKTEITQPEDLSDMAIAVIGLWNMGVHRLDRMSELLRGPKQSQKAVEDSVMRMIWTLQDSQNPIVRACIEEGLPAGMCVKLPAERTIRCLLCGGIVDTVPCPRCSAVGSWEEDDQDFGDPPPLPKRPTNARPGGFQKIRTLQARLSRGEALFHPDDRMT
jgi:hypothetical protein